MNLTQKAGLFLQILIKSISRALSRRLQELGPFENIELTDRLYLKVPKSEVTLMSFGAGGSDVVQSMKLSVDEAKEIFQSIRNACDLNEVSEVKVGELSWRTDAQSNPDTVIIVFNGPLGRTRAIAQRDDVIAAVNKFADRFGPHDGR